MYETVYNVVSVVATVEEVEITVEYQPPDCVGKSTYVVRVPRHIMKMLGRID